MKHPSYSPAMVEKIKAREWICGVGYAVAEVQRLHDEPTIACDVARAAGLSFDDFKKAGMAPYDLKTLRKILPKTPRGKR